MNEEKGIKRHVAHEKKEVKATVMWGTYMVHRLVEHCNKVKAHIWTS